MTESKGPWEHGSMGAWEQEQRKEQLGQQEQLEEHPQRRENHSASQNGNYTCVVGSFGLNVAWPWLELRPSWSNLLHILHPSPHQPPSPSPSPSPTLLTSTSSAEETQTQPEHDPSSPSRRQHLGIPAHPPLDPRPFDDTPTAPKEASTDHYSADEKKLLQSQPIRFFLSPPSAENFQNSIYYSLLPCAVAPLLSINRIRIEQIHFRRNLVLLLFGLRHLPTDLVALRRQVRASPFPLNTLETDCPLFCRSIPRAGPRLLFVATPLSVRPPIVWCTIGAFKSSFAWTPFERVSLHHLPYTSIYSWQAFNPSSAESFLV